MKKRLLAHFLLFGILGVMLCTAAAAEEQNSGGLSEIIKKRPGIFEYGDLREWVRSEYLYVRTYRFFDQGFSCLRSGDLSGAAENFDAIIQIDPDNTLASLYLAYIKSRLGDRDQAITLFEGFVERHGANGYVLSSLAFLYIERGDNAKAIDRLESAEKMTGKENPTLDMIHANLAELYMQAGRYEEAFARFFLLSIKYPGDGLLHYKSALALKALGRTGDAVSQCQQALSGSGLTAVQRSQCRMELADLYMENGDYAAAAQLIEVILGEGGGDGPSRIWLKILLAEAYLKLGRQDAAIEQFNLLYVSDEDSFAGFRLYEIYRDSGQTALARNMLEKISADDRLSPSDRVRGGLEQAFQMIRDKRYVDAEALLEGLLAKKGIDEENRLKVIGSLADAKFKRGRTQEALDLAMSAYRSSPAPDSGLLFLTATLNHRMKHYDIAENLYDKLIRAERTEETLRTQSRRGLGDLLIASGRHKEAAPVFEAILRENPGDMYALQTLMEIAKKEKNPDRYEFYSRQMENRKPSPSATNEIATTLGELGAIDEAIRLLRETLAEETNTRQRFEILRKLGYLSLKSGKRDRAVDYFVQALALPVSSPELMEQLADMYINDGRWWLAMPLLESLSRVRRNSDDQVKFARLMERIGDYNAAEFRYREALKIKQDPETTFALAALFERTGKRSAAIRLIQDSAPKVADDAGLSFRTFILLSKYYGALGNKERQIKYAEKALAYRKGGEERESLVYALVLTRAEDDLPEKYLAEILARKEKNAKQPMLLELATLYEISGNYGKAIGILDAAVSIGTTPELRFKRGVLLSGRGEEAKARSDFEAVIDTHPQSARYLAAGWEREGKPGFAIDILEKVLSTAAMKEAGESYRIIRQLAHLYFEEGRYRKALETSRLTRAYVTRVDTADLLLEARCLIRLGRPNEALLLLENEVGTNSDPDVLSNIHQVLGDALRSQKRYCLSNIHYQQSLLAGSLPMADIHALMADNYFRMGDSRQSHEHYEAAVALEPEKLKFLPGYGFTLAKLGENSSALAVFERYLAVYPRAPRVLEEAAFLKMRESRNTSAAQSFRDAIDLKNLRLEYGPTPPARSLQQKGIYDLKKEVSALEHSFSTGGFIARSDLVGDRGSQLYKGDIPSQAGIEAAWTPPGIGFRNHRIVELTARILGSFDEGAWGYNDRSTQLAVGFRYKPFSSINAVGVFERLVRIGDDSEDNWLVRGLYSRDWGVDPAFGSPLWHSGRVYLDFGAFLDSSVSGERREAFYGELKEGFIYRIHENWGLFPHVIVDTHWDSSEMPLGNYLEGGIGLELTGWLKESEHRSHAIRPSFFVQYKWGALEEPLSPGESRDYKGIVLGTTISFEMGGADE